MELRQIQYILQLFKDGNITKASSKLFISQQGLSKSINRIEDELGFALFERSSSGVIPTDAGLSLYHYFDKVVSSYQDLEGAIDVVKQKHVLRIAAYKGFALSCTGKFYADYRKEYPESRIQYSEADNDMLPDLLQNHQADLAFMLDPVPRALRSHAAIRSDTLCAVLTRSNPLALKRKLSISDLHGQQLLLLNQLENFNDQILKDADAKNISYSIHGRSGMGEFLPLIQDFNLIGFGTKELFRNFNYPDLTYLPIKGDARTGYQAATHLVSLRDSAPVGDSLQFIEHVRKIKEEQD